ncbi:MAG: serine hydrolase [Chryseobacterium sp.]|uniref:serine hydrolase n=1 Tax=Chryseobacterium sp. TaxID=1871047 RepID=UPI0025BCA29D|nr:serine hydrolase [Chryseobacterium sp.]MCJ7932426.1 serine hydrolase [Chryseobacterium sp.]
MRKNILIFMFALAFVKNYAQTDTTIDSIIGANAEKLAQKSGAYSVSVGVLKNGKIYTRHFGEIDKGKGNKANDNTYFEIASVTKLFTGQLLAKAVLDGKIKLDEDVGNYLKGSYPNLEYQGVPIKIKDLISYRTALPNSKLIHTVSVAGNFNDWNPGNKDYQMTRKEKNHYELEIPVSKFEKDKTYSFKFVINNAGWMVTPKRAANVDGTEDNNLILVL